MRAAIYTRVSTDKQEADGTSLDSQKEACLTYCQGKGYDVAYQFKEVYSGLSEARPELDSLRELVRSEQIDVVVIYCLDRFSRNATQGVILRDELDKHNVSIESVTEDIDKTPLGELITYLRGTFAQIEAEKIRQRTMLGKRTRVEGGRLACGGGTKLYGCDYVRGKGTGEGIRLIRESEAQWVRTIFHWYTEDRMTLNSVVCQLRTLGVPSPKGNATWGRGTLQKILRNPAYKGVTYAYRWERSKSGNKRVVERPQNEWVKLDGATPAIVSNELWDLAQVRLDRNKELACRNTKREYLLRSYLFCSNCGRRYIGGTRGNKTKNGLNYHGFYHCSKSSKKEFIDPCRNRTWSADRIEEIVWQQVEQALSNPAIVLSGLEAIRNESGKTSEYTKQLDTIKTQLKHMGKEKDRAWKAYRITGDEDKFKTEVKEVMSSIEELNKRQSELEARVCSANQVKADIEGIEQACKIVLSNLGTLSFEDKREVLETLNIRVWISKDSLRLEGTLPIASTTSIRHEGGKSECVCR